MLQDKRRRPGASDPEGETESKDMGQEGPQVERREEEETEGGGDANAGGGGKPGAERTAKKDKAGEKDEE